MRIVVVGLGIQGQKRRRIAGDDVVGIVDPVNPEASHKRLDEVPLSTYDAALLCTPDDVKIGLMSRLLSARKHVLVEKPLMGDKPEDLDGLAMLAGRAGVACYTAYNHRFEPNIVRMRDLLRSGDLGKIYSVRMFYGNGTARLVRESMWRDSGSGVMRDLGSHLLDLVRFLLGDLDPEFDIVTANRFENRAYDHAVLTSRGPPLIQLEMTLLMWRNHFTCDVLAERGSAHVSSLCKWGPSTFARRTRVFPAGLPEEEMSTIDGPDPTWALEYDHFQKLCQAGKNALENDIWIDRKLADAAMRCRDAERAK